MPPMTAGSAETIDLAQSERLGRVRLIRLPEGDAVMRRADEEVALHDGIPTGPAPDRKEQSDTDGHSQTPE